MMRTKILLAGVVAAVTVPTLALAQPADPACVASNNQTSATGTILGALGGAVLGSAIAGRHDRGVGAVGGALAGGVAGNVLAGQHNDPCPPGYYRPAPPPAYGPPPPTYGAPPPPYPAAGVWRGAPGGLHERIDFLYHRIGEAQQNGYIGRRQAARAYHDLGSIRNQEGQLRNRDGGDLSPPDRDFLNQRLNQLSRRLNWETNGG